MDSDSDSIETLVAPAAVRSFEQRVRDLYRDRCGNCGSDHKLRVRLIVPVDAGGKEIESNAVLNCRACELAAQTAVAVPGDEGAATRLINFWVSRRLFDRIINDQAASHGLKSTSHFVRYMMVKYVADPERYDDLDRYQDSGANDVKINAWVQREVYEKFKRLVNARDLNVTAALAGLMQMFDLEVVEDQEGK